MQGIQSNSETVEQIRERLRKMSDLELRKFGQAARVMADPRKNFGSRTRSSLFNCEKRARSGGDGIQRTNLERFESLL